MRIDYLDYLIEIDKYHSISTAARELFIGQTALSSIVKSVEAELGFAIFRRTHAGVETTPEGEEALALALEIVSRYEEILAIGTRKELDASPIELVSSPSINGSLAGPLSKAYLDLVPDGNLIFSELEGSEIFTRIIQNDFNIGLTYCNNTMLQELQAIAEKYQITVKPIYPDRFYLLMRQGHPLSAKDSVDINEITDQNLAILAYFSNQEASVAFRDFLRQHNRFTTFSSVPLIKRAVAEGDMISVLSGYAIFHEHSMDHSRFCAVPLTGMLGSNQMALCLIHRNFPNLQYAEQVLVTCLQEYFAALTSREETESV